MNKTTNIDEIFKVIYAEHSDPFRVLGIHKVESKKSTTTKFAVRVFIPTAKEINVIILSDNSKHKMEKIHDSGFFQVYIEREDFFSYTLEVTDYLDKTSIMYDPYCFTPILSDYDLYLFNQGNHHKVYEKLGAHVCNINGIDGTLFAVWAPCARRVSVVGSFNNWDGRQHQMRSRGSSGVWELFIPGVNQGVIYKYEIKTPHNEIYLKADPYAFYAELRPDTASIVYDIENNYTWNDSEWIEERDSKNPYNAPISIYEVHLGSWQRTSPAEDAYLSYRDMADKLVNYAKEMGYTHIELMPVAEHPFDGSWGYQITGYYAVTSRYGTPDDFKYFVDKCHQNGIGVIVDWVPAHFPKDGHGLARFDGTALYEHADQKQGEHPDWGTHIFNFGRNEVKNFLVSNALFWFEKYHIDGLRVDAVASMIYLDYGKKDGEWIPNEWGGKENIAALDFMKQANSTVYKYHPGAMMIAEESTSWALVTRPTNVGGLGFGFKWNMGWMNDYLRYISMDSIYRKYHHNLLTFSMIYAFSENFILVLSHDEVVHGKCSMISKMPGDYWQQFAGLRVSYGYMFAHPGKKLQFMGSEFAQYNEWNYRQSLDWHLLEFDMHQRLQNYVKDLNHLYKTEKALYEIDFHYEGFEWIDCNDAEHGVVSFIRKGNDWRDSLIVVCNFTPCVYNNYRIGLPWETQYDEIFNSDSEKYGGSNVVNPEGFYAQDIGYHNRPFSAEMKIPPLAVMILKPRL